MILNLSNVTAPCFDSRYLSGWEWRILAAHSICSLEDQQCLGKIRSGYGTKTRTSRKQLDLIAEAYEESQTRHIGGFPSFWASWWQDLDEILPELTPKERCNFHCLSYWDYQAYKESQVYAREETQLQHERAKIEEEALAKEGYSGLDFIDVIRIYFADILKDESHVTDEEAPTLLGITTQTCPKRSQSV